MHCSPGAMVARQSSKLEAVSSSLTASVLFLRIRMLVQRLYNFFYKNEYLKSLREYLNDSYGYVE